MPKPVFKPEAGTNNREPKQRPSGKPSFRQRNDSAPTWDDVPAVLLHAIVCMACTQGASPTFGYTRNGSSLTLAIYWKGERSVEYLVSPGEVGEYALFLAREWFQLSDEEVSEYGLGPRQTD